jgi:hypothetical protein
MRVQAGPITGRGVHENDADVNAPEAFAHEIVRYLVMRQLTLSYELNSQA